MEYLRIERALNRLIGDSIDDGRFYQTAGAFESILKDQSLSPQQKASQIADILEQGIIEQGEEKKE